MTGSKSDVVNTLAWLVEVGADEALSDVPANRLASTASPSAAPATGLRDTTPRLLPPRPEPLAKVHAPVSDSIGQAMELAASCNSLSELKAALEAFDGCGLKRSATNTVFADGTPANHIMLIGEAPGQEEDLAGLPFVGRAGRLLDKMLAAIGLDRKTNVYITNVLNWRPPNNRDPSPEEAACCLPFLRRHIELVAPRLIVLIGAVSTRHVMGCSEGIMRMRGKWLEYYVNGSMVPVMPILHPAYLLRRPIDKKLAWRDLQEISAKVNSLGLLEQNEACG